MRSADEEHQALATYNVPEWVDEAFRRNSGGLDTLQGDSMEGGQRKCYSGGQWVAEHKQDLQAVGKAA
eukprot:6858862-Karenia_brevis.AAC.1